MILYAYILVGKDANIQLDFYEFQGTLNVRVRHTLDQLFIIISFTLKNKTLRLHLIYSL